jgi:hypothetical protein
MYYHPLDDTFLFGLAFTLGYLGGTAPLRNLNHMIGRRMMKEAVDYIDKMAKPDDAAISLRSHIITKLAIQCECYNCTKEREEYAQGNYAEDDHFSTT